MSRAIRHLPALLVLVFAVATAAFLSNRLATPAHAARPEALCVITEGQPLCYVLSTGLETPCPPDL